ncbi:SPFH domain-containing protein [Streptomyces europaeiscabiei]|uniref:SPFH domain-containing protein n=1 Tax=Streptomyces europaeiscabiei TaxID=146819 RepID=UPI0029A82945|nr:SPFH domain-containing protein [Streptomyces europaeiscabiei]MDX2767542.1 SPFH domain-containing protein [Streptomyces europaeiscabiei]
MFVLSILLLIAAVVVFLVGRGRDGGGWKLGAVLSAVGGALAGVFACVHVVSAYEVGVPVTFGKVGTPLTSGIQFKSPFTEVTSFSTRPVDLNLYDKDVVEVRSSQGGVLYADVTIKWAAVPAKAVALYRLAGSEEAVQERLVLPDSREIIRNVFAKHTSEEGYASAREQIGSEIEDLMKERLAPRGIDITAVNLRNVKPSTSCRIRSTRRSSRSRPPSGPRKGSVRPRRRRSASGSRQRASPPPTRSSRSR